MKPEYDFSKARRGAVVPAAAGKTRITIRLVVGVNYLGRSASIILAGWRCGEFDKSSVGNETLSSRCSAGT
jgi:hypothetical protein